MQVRQTSIYFQIPRKTHIHRLTSFCFQMQKKQYNKNGIKKYTDNQGYSRPGCDIWLERQKIVEKEQIFSNLNT